MCYWDLVGRGQDDAKYFTMHRIVYHSKELPSLESEKPCLKVYSFKDFCSELTT